ncbi:ubiquitin C-terminal hydrolase family protein [Xylogone sp. PMI_703]|nr:ubiquitin C-terminal hydrolase family protein [Xylogone sp. PMI_703]
MNRLLSRREKDGNLHRRQKSKEKATEIESRNSIDVPHQLTPEEKQRKQEQERAAKIHAVKQSLEQHGYEKIDDEAVTTALDSLYAGGNVEKAVEIAILYQESADGIIKPYNPDVPMKGAVNRSNVTCYLDSLLFSMFGRLSSFEPILYAQFADEPRRRLATLIRLWVNMLRTGMLIQTDITKKLQNALKDCGWEEAANIQQQDTSEAFSFITEKLQLPLLTLKMDIYHTGTEDANDDHKLIYERLLEVAVPDETENGRTIQLEDCLENYFNNRIEVVRRLERSGTISSMRTGRSHSFDKGVSPRVEISEVSPSSPNTPVSGYPLTLTSSLPPSLGRQRSSTTSIIRHRVMPIDGEEGEPSTPASARPRLGSIRKGSIRKEVLMPAWQFFNLMPWYTTNSPSSDAEVAAHFTNTRPVLGICLKRYAFSADGQATRKNTFIDIPLDIRLPHFIDEEDVEENGQLIGDFKLSLQSVICHRGKSVQSGHYISFIRGAVQTGDGDATSTRGLNDPNLPPDYPIERWIKFDDLNESARVSDADIEQALKEEMPYLLFYQIQPMHESPPTEPEPPSYADSGVAIKSASSKPPSIAAASIERRDYFDGVADGETTPSIRLSSDSQRPEISLSFVETIPEDRRPSVTFTDASLGSVSSIKEKSAVSAPTTPNDETAAQRMSRAAARFTKSGSKSRPTSATGEHRMSATFSRLGLMRSKEFLNKIDTTNKSASVTEDGTIVASDAGGLKPDDGKPTRSRSKRDKFRNRNKGGEEGTDKAHPSHQHHHKDGTVKEGKNIPDRECTIM